MWEIASILDPGQNASDIFEHVTVLVGTSFTVVVSPCFIVYCIFRWLWNDCNLREKILRRETSTPKSKFLNMNIRLVMGLHLSCFSNSILRVINVFTSTEIEPLCIAQGILLQYTDWFMFCYNFVVALWLFLYIFLGKMIRSWPRPVHVMNEIITHLFCFIAPIFWVLLPLSTTPSHGIVYGKSGKWCWMRPDRLGNVWRMAGLYGPLWIMIAVIVAMYFLCLLVVFVSYHRLNTHEMRGLQGKKLFPKFSHQMFLIIHSEKENRTLIRLSAEWKAYIKLILYPAIFLLVWFIPTVNRVSQIFLDKPNDVLQFLHRLLVSQQGFLSVLIYPVNPIQQLVWIRGLLTCAICRKKRNKSNDFVLDMNLREEDQEEVELHKGQELQDIQEHGNEQDQIRDRNSSRSFHAPAATTTQQELGQL